ncbi:MAG: tautomerase family protein [Azonexus sp.]|jgi:4-oxalocrotonate tautomerase|nr:tautomerase family protein [Azonexus sp.]
MPFLHLQFGQTISSAQKRSLARRSTDLIAAILHKRAEVTAVRIDCIADDGWHLAGEPVADGLTPAHSTLYITAGTNTPAEKAEIIVALHRLLADTCGPLPEASYLVIHEMPAGNWGYDGQTQAARQQARPA